MNRPRRLDGQQCSDKSLAFLRLQPRNRVRYAPIKLVQRNAFGWVGPFQGTQKGVELILFEVTNGQKPCLMLLRHPDIRQLSPLLMARAYGRWQSSGEWLSVASTANHTSVIISGVASAAI